MSARFPPCGSPVLPALLLGMTTLLAASGPAHGQARGCTLVLEPASDSTRSVRIEVAPERYVTHVGGGLRWTCGSARMVADSAVRRPGQGRLRMIGSVDYRDSLRTLLADTVVYIEGRDRIVAAGDVRLTRLANGATLEGPRVEFLRGPGGELRRTVATGRPAMTLPPDSGSAEGAAPTRVDADSIVLEGESVTRTWGDVRIRRSDMNARADSATFRMDDGEGQLYGSPEVRGETWTLTGGRIDTRFSEGEIREVEAVERARARGDDFRLFAPRIRARVADREIERLWASGEGRSVAYSTPYRLTGDSLAFRFAGGRIRQLRSVGTAEAVEVGDSIPSDPLADVPLAAADRSWVAADTLELTFGDVEPGGPVPEGEQDRLADGRPRPERPRRGEERDENVHGGEGAVGEVPPVESLRPADAEGDSLAAGDPVRERDAAGSESGSDPVLRRIRATVDARAYYLLEPEEEGGRPPRHYQVGREIVVHLRGGAAHRIEGRAAVGIHLDPQSGDGEGPPPPPGEGGG